MTVTATVGKRRLLELVKLLQGLPRKRFDLSTWVGEDWQGRKDLSCGTTGCALGWATTIPMLKRAGLRLLPYSSGPGGYVGLFQDGCETHLSGEFAAEEVFGITYEEARYLFNGTILPPYEFRDKLKTGPEWEATPKQVAKHIKRFVKAKFPND